MKLDERKQEILKAIINNYFETALPVGSRTISKQYNLGVSPATIRNEMSDLEELGFIIQPHASAGRIPSDKGYRLYVDMVMQLQKSEYRKLVYLEELKASAGRIEDLLKSIAKRLAEETNYATLVSTPQYKKTRIRNIQLVEVSSQDLLVIVVAERNQVKDHLIHLEQPVNQELLTRLSVCINQELRGMSLEDIDLNCIHRIKGNDSQEQRIMSEVLDVIFRAIQQMDEADIFTYGASNMMKLPEFQDVSKASSIMRALEQEEILEDIINTTFESDDGNVKIVIGEENNIQDLKDLSLITTSYHINGEKAGAIAIIGPKRMDYENTISNLRVLIKDIDELLTHLSRR
ncbi:heat-inducible transcription repressor HrcA [Lachnospiraceae bacterium oral taxon 500]|nr:heat-inducible transcription repressor HrcA [Lachnospiraceae bacterium oral taxon 500]